MSYFTWYELMRRQQNPEVPPISPVIVMGLYGSNDEGTIVSWEELTNTGFEPVFNSLGTGIFALQNLPENTNCWCQGLWLKPDNTDKSVTLTRWDTDTLLLMMDSGTPTGIEFANMPMEFLFFPVPIV